MPGPTPTFNWPAEIGQTVGGLLAMLIVGVLALGSVVWSAVEIWRRR